MGYLVRVSETRRGRRVSFLLSALGTYAARGFAEAVAGLELSPGDAGTLRLLARNPAVSQRDLATRLGIVPSRVVVMIDSLEKRGLVERRRKKTDRRLHELHLTKAAQQVLPRIRVAAERADRQLLAPLDDREQRELIVLLGKLAAGHGLDPDVHPGHSDD